jgi:hypothetical protein
MPFSLILLQAFDNSGDGVFQNSGGCFELDYVHGLSSDIWSRNKGNISRQDQS